MLVDVGSWFYVYLRGITGITLVPAAASENPLRMDAPAKPTRKSVDVNTSRSTELGKL